MVAVGFIPRFKMHNFPGNKFPGYLQSVAMRRKQKLNWTRLERERTHPEWGGNREELVRVLPRVHCSTRQSWRRIQHGISATSGTSS